eukprot:TRINITY_DN3583_c2_g1_i4.p1 TRINITY_DN3583_c2_g1~~TRINITY_DN3583_c2_g1_i4.p1  ORF type:complete len:633 (-),score=87.05 TRINITY_DN3583_c2_g1_i4:112-2010(-)
MVSSKNAKLYPSSGEYTQISPLIIKSITQFSKVLVPGCGNSELSAQLYDDGINNIVNIDFSKVVIREMLSKNLRQRPSMKWMVADMTKTKFQDDEFDVILDKGSLDAVMGEESEESAVVGKKYLLEMQRILRKGSEGLIFVITLAQIHVLQILVNLFSRSQWSISIHKVPPTKDMARSPLQPFLFAAKHRSRGESWIQIKFNVDENAPDADHVKEVTQFLEGAQSSEQSQDFDELHAGRRLQINVPTNSEQPRYLCTIIDSETTDIKQHKIRCTVLLIPQGRENEWLFGNKKGQKQITEQCGAGRLILVALCRGHKFGSQKEVMQELSQYIVQFAPADVRHKENAIPYQTVQEGIGKRKEIVRVSSDLNGEIVVEDVMIEDEEHRRLIFISACQLVQSEAVLQKVSNNKKKKIPIQAVDHSILPSEYHQLMTAAVLLQDYSSSSLQCLLIGLGGGGLPMFLNKILGINVCTVELDPTVLEVATKYFNFQQSSSLTTQITDGIKFIQSEDRKYQIVMLDAGSSDPSLPMSCPPPDFIELEQLKQTKQILSCDGMLIINCVCRDEDKFLELVCDLKGVFSLVFQGDIDDDVNRVLAAFDLCEEKKQGCQPDKYLKDKLQQYDWFGEQFKQFKQI